MCARCVAISAAVWLEPPIAEHPSDVSGCFCLISQAYVSGQPEIGTETIHLGWGTITCQVEAMSMRMGDQTVVPSLLNCL